MKKSSISDVKKLLTDLGLRRGDVLLVFSDITTLGQIENGVNGVVEALLETLGPEGTLVVPTYTFSFCKTLDFDLKNSKSECGILTNTVRELPGAIRSVQPIHSLAAVGPHKSDALKATDKSSFGPGSAFTSMLDLDVKVLLLGVTVNNTYAHYIEQEMNVEYRYPKKFTGTIRVDDRSYQDTFDFFVRRLDLEGTSSDYHRAQKMEFFATPYCREIEWAYGTHRLFRAHDFCNFLRAKLRKDPLYLVDKSKYFDSKARAHEQTQ